jgi:uncharacterized membrane protein
LKKTLIKQGLKNLILEEIRKEKPENVKELKQLMLQNHNISPESTTKLLLELEKEEKLHFLKSETLPTSTKEYIFSEKALWYWEIVGLSIVISILVLAIPETAFPIIYVRNGVGLIFALFLPGYSFVKVIFPKTVPFKTSSGNLDNIERLAISLVMSLSIVSIVGLLLNFTSWGIKLMPITLSLLTLTLIFATGAIIREHQIRQNKN